MGSIFREDSWVKLSLQDRIPAILGKFGVFHMVFKKLFILFERMCVCACETEERKK